MSALPDDAELTDPAGTHVLLPGRSPRGGEPGGRCLPMAPTGSPATASARALLAAGALLLLLGTAVSSATGWDGGFAAGATTCFLLCFGVAPALGLRTADVSSLVVVSVATSLSACVSTAMLMAVTGAWHPFGAFLGWACVSALWLLFHLRREFLSWSPRGIRLEIPQVPRAQLVSWSMAVTGLVLTIVDARVHRQPPTPGGLLTIVGPAWYLGLFLLLTAVAIALLHGVGPGVAVLLLSLPVVLSQAIAYGTPTVMPASRHIGVVEFIRTFHQLDRVADIYHAWAGLFAATAWLSDVARIDQPLTTVATYWPVAVTAATVVAVRVLAGGLGLSRPRAWWAAATFVLANTLNVTYFSPQSLGFFLCLVVAALVVRTWGPDTHRATRVLLVVTLSCATAVTHQISPYLLTAALVVLMGFGLVRPRWPAVATLVPAVIWAVLNRGQVGQYLSMSALGNIFGNIRPPSTVTTEHSESLITRLVFGLPSLVLVGVGLAALLALWQRRDRRAWALTTAAASPLVLALASNYGQEAIFRIALFSLPWLCLCAALLNRPRRWAAPLLAAGMVVLVGVNAFGLTGMDWARVVRADEAQQLGVVERNAPVGSTIYALGTFAATPGRSTERYFDVRYDAVVFDGPAARLDAHPGSRAEAVRQVAVLAADLRPRCTASCFLVVSTSARADTDRYGVQALADSAELARAFASAPDWQMYSTGPTATVYELEDEPDR
ncbi:hypothetical protein [Modestobacter sp. URMC 112]